MEVIANNIIQSMNKDMFTTPFVEDVIIKEVEFFKKILQDNLYNEEIFHGYINKILASWGSILKNEFKRYISIYNQEYDRILKRNLESQKEMVNMAVSYDAEMLDGEVTDMFISPNLNNLTSSMSKNKIAKKKTVSKKKKSIKK